MLAMTVSLLALPLIRGKLTKYLYTYLSLLLSPVSAPPPFPFRAVPFATLLVFVFAGLLLVEEVVARGVRAPARPNRALVNRSLSVPLSSSVAMLIFSFLFIPVASLQPPRAF